MVAMIKSPNGTALYISGGPEYRLGTDYTGDKETIATYIYANKLSIPGATIRTKEIHVHTASATVDASGAILKSSGTDGILNTSATSRDADATDAFPISISTADFKLPNKLWIEADGGNGGIGFTSSDTQLPSGIGGRAGNGANITLLVDTEYDRVASAADAIIAAKGDPDAKTQDMLNWAKSAQLVTTQKAPDGISWVYTMKIDSTQPDLDPSGPLPHSINAKTFLGLMAVTAQTLRATGSEFLSSVGSRAGMPGLGGLVTGSDKRVASGQKGREGVVNVGPYSTQAIVAGNELIFHPAQVSATMQDIANSYLIGTQDSIGDAMGKLKDLTARLGFLQDVKPTDKLYQAYMDHEYDTLAVLPSGLPGQSSAFNTLSTNLRLANQYMVRINQGYDFYQHASTWVPRANYNFYQKKLDSIMVDFDAVENNYNEYQKLLADNAKQSEQVEKALNAARRGEEQARHDLASLDEDLVSTAQRIASLQEDVPRKRAAVATKLDEIADKIKTQAEAPSMKDFLSAAGQMAFCPEPEMAAVQGATLLNSSLTQIRDNAGNAVEKSYVVQQIHQLASGVDGLKEALQLDANDAVIDVDDPGATKLLGQESDVMDLVNKYRNAIGGDADDFKTMFDDYVQTVVQRNNQVMHYNNVIAVYLQTKAKLDSYVADQHSLGTEEALTENSQIPALANTIKSSYFDYTAKVLELLYDTQRALTFWALTSGTVSLSALRDQGFPSTSLGAQLKTLQGDLIMDFTNEVESLDTGRQPFGVAAGSSGLAKIVTLNTWQIGMLKTTPSSPDGEYFTTFTLDAASKSTRMADNVFAGKADVRISTMRVYIEGAKTDDGILRFNLQQLGSEKIVSVNNETRRFTHDRLQFPYEYEIATKTISVDGNLDVDPSYALPGPFATWRIGLSPLTNTALDLSEVESVKVQFSGWSRSFR